MPQLELPLQTSAKSESLPYSQARLIELWCAEPVFFASRELSDTYYTEGAIGNYALAYAMGWVRSPYRLRGQASSKPTYKEDLGVLAGQGYILPAWPVDGKVTFRFERFNALSDSYWYAMTNNRVATARQDVPLARTGKKPNSYRASNFPQTGRLRLIERGNVFQTLVLGNLNIPEYIRLGKFMSKVRVEIMNTFDLNTLPVGNYSTQAYLNVADLSRQMNFITFDLIAIPPASLLKNLHFYGEAWQMGDYIVPAHLQFCGA